MKILVLCERVDNEGGTETYLRLTLPALLAAGDEVRVVARSAGLPDAYGVPAQAVAWSDEHDPPSASAAAEVGAIAQAFGPDVVVAHNVLDAARAGRQITESGRSKKAASELLLKPLRLQTLTGYKDRCSDRQRARSPSCPGLHVRGRGNGRRSRRRPVRGSP